MIATPIIRSRAILDHARNQPCTLRFPGICNHNPETTVAAHIRDSHKGMGIKASDYSVVFACSDCHRFLDEKEGSFWLGTTTPIDIIRALQETWGILIRDGIITVPQDAPKQKAVKPRKPRSQRKKIQSRNDLRKRTD